MLEQLITLSLGGLLIAVSYLSAVLAFIHIDEYTDNAFYAILGSILAYLSVTAIGILIIYEVIYVIVY